MTEEKDDQASLLRQQIEAVQNHNSTESAEIEHKTTDTDKDWQVNVLDLPPRSEIHAEKEAKVKLKISFALIRLVVILFLIIVGFILTYHFWGDQFLHSAEHNSNSNAVGERVRILANSQTLSNEVTIYVQLNSENEEVTPLTGRYYISEASDTVETIANRFYQSTDIIPLLKKINNLTSNELDENQRVFLPMINNG